MLRCQNKIIALIFLSILTSTVPSYAEEEIDDLIDLFESENEIVAIIAGNKTAAVKLQPKETVQWHGSKGNVGAFLTNQQFAVISPDSPVWHTLPMKLNESEKSVVSLSPYIAILATAVRAIGFNSSTNRFFEIQLPMNDELIAVKAEKNVAVVVTSSRLYGVAAKMLVFHEFRLRIRESVEEIKIASNRVTVRTSDRFLTFEAKGASWKEY